MTKMKLFHQLNGFIFWHCKPDAVRCRAATSMAKAVVYTSVELIDLWPIRLCKTFLGMSAYSMCIA